MSLLISGQKVSIITSRYGLALLHIVLFWETPKHIKDISFISKSFFNIMTTCWILSNFSSKSTRYQFLIYSEIFSLICKCYTRRAFYHKLNAINAIDYQHYWSMLHVAFPMDYCIWLTNILLLFRFCTYTREKSQARVSTPLECSIASFACTCFLRGYPVPAFLSGEMESFSSVVFTQHLEHSSVGNRPGHLPPDSGGTECQCLPLRGTPLIFLKSSGTVIHPLGTPVDNNLEISLFLFDSYCAFPLGSLISAVLK